MVQILNQYQRAMSLLVSQFRGEKSNGDLTNLQKLIKCLIVPFQMLEDTKWQLKTERWLSTAVGVQLDEFGIILGLPREENESDDAYRERLYFQIFINTSSGTSEQIMAVLAFLTNASHVSIHDYPIAGFQLETNGIKGLEPPYLPNSINEAIFRVSPAGVNYAAIVATYGAPIPFQLGGDSTPEPLFVAPDPDDPSYLTNLLMEPYNKILYVNAGAVEDTGPDGGLDELNFPLETAGQLSELIQLGGNFPPRRF